ncbi:hypothetical protein KP509_01G005800 [Ceratopteris richardii]|uniref:Reverse transcriptase zinc-binding domain-containing protein n=1 Tax=Ceratopteris richardii TaxID=49495 RepID=A0A8T2VDT1_CERRI|nr:hypothetical protein KP509_01G005800 [Ceratopteris richardii]
MLYLFKHEKHYAHVQTDESNIQNILASLTSFSEAPSLHVNMRKSALINVFMGHFEFLPWQGPKIDRGMVFQHLGYQLGVNISTDKKLQWVFRKIKCKMELWHSSQWPLHVRIRIVQAFLHPNVMHYLLLLDWKKCHLHAIDCLVKSFLWDRKHNRALVTSAWDFVCQPKAKGGLGILHLHSHTMARWTAFLMCINSSYKPLWTDTFWRFIKNAVRWKLKKSRFWWHARFCDIWESSFTFKMKIFMWRILVGHFTLWAFLSKHGLKGVRCPHCATYAETMRHAFSAYPCIQRWWNNLLLFPI